MKDSEVYLEAAKLIDSGVELFSCAAIDQVLNQHDSALAQNYCSSMGFVNAYDFFDLYGFTLRTPINIPARRHRVLLLLLASAIAESEGR